MSSLPKNLLCEQVFISSPLILLLGYLPFDMCLVWAVEFVPNGCLVFGAVLEKQLCMKLEEDDDAGETFLLRFVPCIISECLESWPKKVSAVASNNAAEERQNSRREVVDCCCFHDFFFQPHNRLFILQSIVKTFLLGLGNGWLKYSSIVQFWGGQRNIFRVILKTWQERFYTTL